MQYILSFLDFIFMNFFAGKVDKVTGSDVIVETLLERNSVCNRKLYVFLVISCTRTNTKGILASKNMPNRCILYALSTRAYYDVTSGNNFDCEQGHEDDIFERQDVLHFFSEESKDYQNAKSPNKR